jgi:hypothetical protein
MITPAPKDLLLPVFEEFRGTRIAIREPEGLFSPDPLASKSPVNWALRENTGP